MIIKLIILLVINKCTIIFRINFNRVIINNYKAKKTNNFGCAKTKKGRNLIVRSHNKTQLNWTELKWIHFRGNKILITTIL